MQDGGGRTSEEAANLLSEDAMPSTLTAADRTALKRILADPVAYIEHLLFLRDMDAERLVRFRLNAEQREVMALRKGAIQPRRRRGGGAGGVRLFPGGHLPRRRRETPDRGFPG